MSLERAGEFVLEFLNDEEASARADQVFLDAVAEEATSRGYDTTAEELRQAFRALADLDGDEVEGFGFTPAAGTVFLPGSVSATAPNMMTDDNVGFGARVGNWAQPLGFLRGF